MPFADEISCDGCGARRGSRFSTGGWSVGGDEPGSAGAGVGAGDAVVLRFLLKVMLLVLVMPLARRVVCALRLAGLLGAMAVD